MRELLRRISYLWNRRRLERELADEMAYHRELMSPERRADFGSDLRLREDAREIWGWAWLDRLRQDLAYGARVLRKSPAFTLTAMLVLALGIGVPLTAFRQVLFDLQGAAPPDPDTLVRLARRAPDAHITQLPYPAFAFYSANARSFRAMIAVSPSYQAALGETGGPEQVQLVFATASYFAEFGVAPTRGRVLLPEDEQNGAGPTAILGEAFWQRRFGGDPAIIGRDLRVNGKPVRIVGIAPASLRNAADLWMPLLRQPYVIEGSTLLTDWNGPLDLYARLSPGVSPQASEQETRSLAARLRELRPNDVRANEYLEARTFLQLDSNGPEFQIALTASALVLVLLVAGCANLGLLVLARGVAREHEIRTRMALGAGRPRIVRQLFTESLLLAALSALCALALSSLVMKALQLHHNTGVAIGLFPGWLVLAVTAGMALLAALVFGLPPALRLTSAVPRGGRARTIFLGAQVAASCLLLVVSSLLVGGLQRLGEIDPGFDHRHIVSVSPGLNAHGYTGPAAQAYFDRLRAQAAALPGVHAASLVRLSPWGDAHMAAGWSGRQFASNQVDSQFLDTMGIRLLRGRGFRPGEQNAAIVTEAAAPFLWPGQDALGKPLPWDPQVVIVGVVRNASTTAIGATRPLEFYTSLARSAAPDSFLLLRVSGRPQASARALQELTRSLDPRLQPTVRTLEDAYARELEKVSRALFVVTILGAVAILLSAIGLAGLAGYTVAQRTREIGLRMALGARTGQVVRAILAPMTHPVVVGFLCGALGGAAAAKILGTGLTSLSGLNFFDPRPYLMALVLFTAVAALAVLAPARRAIRIDPSKAIQHQ